MHVYICSGNEALICSHLLSTLWISCYVYQIWRKFKFWCASLDVICQQLASCSGACIMSPVPSCLSRSLVFIILTCPVGIIHARTECRLNFLIQTVNSPEGAMYRPIISDLKQVQVLVCTFISCDVSYDLKVASCSVGYCHQPLSELSFGVHYT